MHLVLTRPHVRSLTEDSQGSAAIRTCRGLGTAIQMFTGRVQQQQDGGGAFLLLVAAAASNSQQQPGVHHL